MSTLGDRIRGQAAISSRAGQLEDLERIAAEVDDLTARLAAAERTQRAKK